MQLSYSVEFGSWESFTVYRLHDKKPGLKNRFIRTACADYIFTGRGHVSIYSTWPAWPAVLFMCSLQFTGFKGTVTRDFRALVFKNYLRKQNKQMFSFYFLPQTFFSKTRLFLCTVIENALLFQGSNKYKSSCDSALSSIQHSACHSVVPDNAQLESALSFPYAT